MNLIDKLTKETRVFLDSIRDTVESGLTAAVNSGKLKLDDSQLKEVIKYSQLLIEEGYQKSTLYFQNLVKKIINNK